MRTTGVLMFLISVFIGLIGASQPLAGALPLYFSSLGGVICGCIFMAVGEVLAEMKAAAKLQSGQVASLVAALSGGSLTQSANRSAGQESSAAQAAPLSRGNDWPKPDWLKADR